MPDPTDPLHPTQDIVEHAPRSRPFEPAVGQQDSIEAVTAWAEEHLGPVETVLHEIVSDLVHLDVHVVPPYGERRCFTLVTSGMSDRPMSLPEEADSSPYAELMISLPADWPLNQEAFQDESNYWPVRWLKMMARLPHEYDTWLGVGHTVPNGNPAEPFAPNTNQCCMLVLPPVGLKAEAWSTTASDGRQISFFALCPIYEEEMELKLRKGTDALLARFERVGVDIVVDPRRRNAAKRRFGLF